MNDSVLRRIQDSLFLSANRSMKWIGEGMAGLPLARIGSSLVAIPLALVMLLLGGWYFTAGFCLLVFLGQLEYFQLAKAKGLAPAIKTTLIVSQVLLVLSNVNPALADALFPIAGTFICFYLLFQTKMASIADIAASVLGLFYGGYLPSFWIRLRALQQLDFSNLPLDGFWITSWKTVTMQAMPQGLSHIVLAFFCIWAADIGAYVFGRILGRTRLSDISPKKTVEGAVFGFAGSLGIAIAGAWVLHWPFFVVSGASFGLLIAVSSLLGDLTESLMKRDAGVKDSGALIPGHGGILDRTDSYVFTAPLVYYFVTLLLPLLSNMI
ncbi:phosphatidate cytidylyltransferase [Alkalinema pantanalense CENA528]|uniref:phosphatidate cytidylyltransferase n=1 Tax=Alkalinema pantanalense TaxID=1620705 RepID=UPI003D6DACBC